LTPVVYFDDMIVKRVLQIGQYVTNSYSGDDDLAMLRLLKKSRWVGREAPAESLVGYGLDYE